jgi:hypothetical protein
MFSQCRVYGTFLNQIDFIDTDDFLPPLLDFKQMKQADIAIKFDRQVDIA